MSLVAGIQDRAVRTRSATPSERPTDASRPVRLPREQSLPREQTLDVRDRLGFETLIDRRDRRGSGGDRKRGHGWRRCRHGLDLCAALAASSRATVNSSRAVSPSTDRLHGSNLPPGSVSHTWEMNATGLIGVASALPDGITHFEVRVIAAAEPFRIVRVVSVGVFDRSLRWRGGPHSLSSLVGWPRVRSGWLAVLAAG